MSKITNRLAFFAKIKKRSDDLETYVAKASGKAEAGAINVHEDHKPFVEREPYVANRYATDINYAVSQYPVKDTAITNFDVEARAKKVSQGHFTGASHYLVNEVMFENAGARGYTLMVTGWTGKGTITKTVGGVVNEGPYAPGTAVTVTVTPNAGYVFTKWSDDVTDNPRTIIMNSNVVLAAVIDTVPVYALNFSATGFGTVAATAAGTAVQSGVQLEAGVDVALTATPNEGYVVDQWSGLPEGAEVSGNTASFLMPAAAVTAGVNFVEAPAFQGLKLTNVETVTSITIGEEYTFPFFAVVQGDHYFQWGDSSNQICTDKRNPAVGDSAYDGGGTPYPITAVTTSSENTLDFTPDLATGFESMSYSLDDGATFNSWPTAPGVGGLHVEHAQAGAYAGDYVYGYEGSEGYWWYLVTNTEKYVTTTVRNPQVGDSVYCRGEHELAGGITSVTSGCVESVEIESNPGVTYWFTNVQPSGSAPYHWTAEGADPIFTAVRHPSIGTSVYSSQSSETPSSTVTAATQETAFVSVTYTGSICLKGKSDVWTVEVGQNSFKSSICVNASGRLSSIISDTDTPQELEELSLVSVFGTMTPGTFPGVSVVDASGLVLDDTLNVASYGAMFANNVTLTAAPSVLPASTLASDCYQYMFYGCIGLTTAPSLPATTLASNCYNGMFRGCTGLTTAPSLPATTLAERCYNSMFLGCTSLVNVPEVLPALELPADCYCEMFENCTSLVTAPAISATSFGEIDPNGDGACYCMFKGCTSLVTAPPHLYAETVPAAVYSEMFYGCTSLVNAPEIHAITATPNEAYLNGAFQNMFNECSSLVNPSVMTALTTVHEYCCSGMFCDCTSLVESPILSATTLAHCCYDEMFSGCTNLTKVTCLATDISADSCTWEWLIDVAEEGTFHRNPDTWAKWTRDENGIPSGWEVVPPAPVDTRLKFISSSTNGVYNSTASTIDFYYSTDGESWTTMPKAEESAVSFGTDGIFIKGTNTSTSGATFKFTGAGQVTLTGDLTCVINNGVGGVTELPDYAFRALFTFNTAIVDASGLILPSTTIGQSCYAMLFWRNSGLVAAPNSLPATTLGNNCYSEMFYGCSALTSIPSRLPSMELSYGCYNSMFASCTALETVPELPATTLADHCYEGMFKSCSKITTAPTLPAATLTLSCYKQMFMSCSRLTSITCNATNIAADSCTGQWVSSVSGSGDFFGKSAAGWTTGVNGIPSGWTAHLD